MTEDQFNELVDHVLQLQTKTDSLADSIATVDTKVERTKYLSRLFDVNVAYPAENDILVYDKTGKWKNAQYDEVGLEPGEGGGGSSDIYVIGIGDDTLPTNENVYSAARTIEDWVSSKNPDDVEGTLTFVNGAKIIVDGIQSTKMTQGTTLGSGFLYSIDRMNNSYLEVDSLCVRKSALFNELEIKKVTSIGGSLVVSPANNTIIRVDEVSAIYNGESQTVWRCYYRNVDEDKEEAITTDFQAGDLAKIQTFNINGAGIYENISNRYYWGLVLGTGSNSIGGYIDLSLTDKDVASNAGPKAGDALVMYGNKTDSRRLNVIDITTYANNAPAITLYQGINDYTTADKAVIEMAYDRDQTQDQAYFNVYGRAYIGAKDKHTFVKYDPTEDNGKGLLTIRGKVIFESGEDAKDYIDTTVTDNISKIDVSGAVDSAMDGIMDNINQNVQNAIDSSIGNLGDLVTNIKDSLDGILGDISNLTGKVNNAQDAADNALLAANTAQSAANNAQTIAGNAQNTANSANTTVNNLAGTIGEIQKDINEILLDMEDIPTDTTLDGLREAIATSIGYDDWDLFVAVAESSPNKCMIVGGHFNANLITADVLNAAIVSGNIIWGNALLVGNTGQTGSDGKPIFNFTVTPQGILTAKDAIIEGNIVATGGSFTGEINAIEGNIGGFHITEYCLSNDYYDDSSNHLIARAYIQVYYNGSTFARFGKQFISDTTALIAGRADGQVVALFETYGTTATALKLLCNGSGEGSALTSSGNVSFNIRDSEEFFVDGRARFNNLCLTDPSVASSNIICPHYSGSLFVTNSSVTLPSALGNYGRMYFVAAPGEAEITVNAAGSDRIWYQPRGGNIPKQSALITTGACIFIAVSNVVYKHEGSNIRLNNCWLGFPCNN